MRQRLRLLFGAVLGTAICAATTAAHAQPARTVTGVVIDSESSAGIVGATVEVKDAKTPLVVQTAEGGAFSLARVPTKEVVLVVSAPGFNQVEVPVKAGAGGGVIAVTLVKTAPPPPPPTRQISGLVRDGASGEPLVGATVAVQGTEISTVTDPDGLFVLSGVDAGDVVLDVFFQDYTAAAVQVRAGDRTTKVELRPTAPPEPEVPTTRTLRGRVVEVASGQGVAGATVIVTGTSLAAITDADGRFEITGVPVEPVQLTIESSGYQTATLEAPAGVTDVVSSLDFVAASEEIIIEGRAPVIVKQNLASGASVVKAEDLNRVSAQTLDTAMVGKVSGANIQTNSGAPGGGTQLRLRGISTINGQSSPLYVVDGVILSNVAIASGANAITAAAAGGSQSNQDNPVNRIADINPNDIENVEVLKGASAAALYGSKAANGVVIITTRRGRPGQTNVSVTQRLGFSQVSNTLGSRTFQSAQEVMDTYGDPDLAAQFTGESFNHERDLTQTPMAYETIASASTSTTNGTYSGSVLVRDEPGVVRGTFYEKQSARLGVSYNFDNRLAIGLTTNLIHSRADRGLTNNDNTGTSLYVALSSTPSFIDLRAQDGVFPFNPTSSSNPLQTVALLQNEEDVWRFIGSANASYKLWSDDTSAVTLHGIFGADRFQQVNDLFAPPELQFEPDDGLAGTSIEGSTANLNYNVAVGALWAYTPKHKEWRSALSAGITNETVDLTSVYVFSRNLTAGQPNVDSGSSINTTQGRLRTVDQGIYLQEEVALLDERLNVLAGLLAERSSLNGDSAKFFVFPKLAATFQVPLTGTDIEIFRVRGAYGEAGNRPNYGQKFTALNATNTIDTNPGLVVGGAAGDPDIEPERQREFEFGVDAVYKDQLIALELTGYQRNISNLLLQRALAPSTGFTTQFENNGSMRNRGIEAAVRATPVVVPVEWTTTAILTLNRSEITDLPGEAFNVATVGFGAGLGAYRIEEGKSVTQIVSDVDGDGVFDVIGNGEPDFRVGWANQFKYGDFGLFTLVDWQQGSDVINLTRLLYDFGQVSPDFVGAGEARLEAFSNGDIRPYVEDGTFIKLREVSVHYTVPKNLASQMGPVEALQVSLSGRNLYTMSNYSGLDPEVSNFGNQAVGRNYDVAPYPPSRSFWLSVSAGF